MSETEKSERAKQLEVQLTSQMDAEVAAIRAKVRATHSNEAKRQANAADSFACR